MIQPFIPNTISILPFNRWDSAGQPSFLSNAEKLNLVHDRNGNLVSGDGNFRIYNSLNQLWKIHNETSEAGRLLEEYIYHPTEERVWVKKVYNASAEVAETTIYISETFVRVLNSSGTYDFAYIKHEGQLVAQVAAGGNTEFVHGDNKGSSSVVTDSLGNAIENTSYELFGGIVSGGQKTRFDYEEKEFDSVVGDYDFHARKYIPSIGWAQPDTLIQNVYEPPLLNSLHLKENTFEINGIKK